ncbi:hypothetical protein KC614_03310 [candidate division WWE3 bacterium]|uniref:Uncharacterized protein n=1 Tax=candidate division WWE3 bacterium TaxID=2053526 RepID=A0A955RS40_UNCKA|nr:hypothetical protein [candidate division WWE3 bacterium]
MPKNLQVATQIVKVFVYLYVGIAIVVLLYGVYSILTKRTRVFGDDDSSYRYSPLASLSIKFHRIIPRKNQQYGGSAAQLYGILYVVVGLLMLAPVIYYLAK